MADEPTQTPDAAAEAYAKLKALREAAKLATQAPAPDAPPPENPTPPVPEPLVTIADAPAAAAPRVIIETANLFDVIEEKAEEVVEFLSEATKAEMECGRQALEKFKKSALAELGIKE